MLEFIRVVLGEVFDGVDEFAVRHGVAEFKFFGDGEQADVANDLRRGIELKGIDLLGPGGEGARRRGRGGGVGDVERHIRGGRVPAVGGCEYAIGNMLKYKNYYE